MFPLIFPSYLCTFGTPISINKCFTTQKLKETSLAYKRMLKYWKEYTEEVKSFLHRKTLRWCPQHWWSPPLGPKITRYKKWFGSFSLDVGLFVKRNIQIQSSMSRVSWIDQTILDLKQCHCQTLTCAVTLKDFSILYTHHHQSVTSRLETSRYRDFSQFFESIGLGLEKKSRYRSRKYLV